MTADIELVDGDLMIEGTSAADEITVDEVDVAQSTWTYSKATRRWVRLTTFTPQIRATIRDDAGRVVLSQDVDPGAVDHVFVNALGGDDTVRNNTSIPSDIDGGVGNDLLVGGHASDAIFGRFGNDTIYGRGSADELWGDAPGYTILDGDDLIDGGWGDDMISGGGGDDVLYGGSDSDTMFGESGDDLMFGDRIMDADSADRWADLGYAVEVALSQADRGEAGNDTMFGGSGSDDLWGDDGDDQLHGDAGRDFLYGGDGNDTLGGGTGSDVMFGGDDLDTIFFQFNDYGVDGWPGSIQYAFVFYPTQVVGRYAGYRVYSG